MRKRLLVSVVALIMALGIVGAASGAGAIAMFHCAAGHGGNVLVEFSGTQRATAVILNTSTGLSFLVPLGSVKCPIPRVSCLAIAGTGALPWNNKVISITITAVIPPVIVDHWCS